MNKQHQSAKSTKHIAMGMIGLGTVGTGIVRLLARQHRLVLKKIAVRHLQKRRVLKPSCPISNNVADIIADPEIEILIEVMGGEHPALEYIQQALESGKHVITANKEVLAKHGPALFKIAQEKGVNIFFEASVAGGIPLIATMHKGLGATKIISVIGILNGTTNFILSQLEKTNLSYSSVLSLAQQLGIAEADPSADIDGHDVAYKLSIISALAFGQFVNPDSIYKEGIACINAADIKQAMELGYRIKLIGITKRTDNEQLDVRVHPMLIPITHPLASVSDSQNGIIVSTEAIDQIMLVGPGAGQMATASAVIGDIVNLSTAMHLPDFGSYFHFKIAPDLAEIAAAEKCICPFYLRLSVIDIPGVIGQIGTIFGAHSISINTILQKGISNDRATIIILTENVQNSDMYKALQQLSKCDFLKSIEGCIRVLKPVIQNAQ